MSQRTSDKNTTLSPSAENSDAKQMGNSTSYERTETHGAYKDYSAETVASEQKAGQKVVLFFHAKWCPFCKTADKAFRTKLDQIPAGVTILKTDYDSQKELKQKYAVTHQHTFVQIDNTGNQITQWNGGDIDNLVKYLQ